MPDVRMPDGTIIRNVPANATKAQIQSAYERARQAGAVEDKRPTSFLQGMGTEIANAGMNFASVMEKTNPVLSIARMAGAPMPSDLGTKAVRQQERQSKYQGSTAGKIAGGVVGSIPLMFAPQARFAGLANAPRVAKAAELATNVAVQGGGSGYAMTRDRNNPKQVAKDVATGMAGDLVGRGLGRVVAGAIGGKAVPKNVRMLADEGVVLTPGQRAGKNSVRNVVEDKVLGSIPFVSNVVDAARERGTNDLRRAVANRVLSPIGEKVPTGTNIDNAFIGALQDKVYSNLDDAAGKMRLSLDDELVNSLAGIQQNAPRLVGNEGAGQINANINYIADRLGQGELSGDALRETLGEVRKVASSAQGTAREQLWNVHDELVNALGRQNDTGAYKAFADARESATLLKRMEDAASRPGVTDGQFGPTQLAQAVRRRGYGTTTANLASGDARLYDLANAATDVMRNTTANSGTVPRAIGAGMLSGAAGGAALVDPTIGALTAGSLAGYIPGVDRALQNLALNRPAVARELADLMRRNNRAFGLLGAVGAPGLLGK